MLILPLINHIILFRVSVYHLYASHPTFLSTYYPLNLNRINSQTTLCLTIFRDEKGEKIRNGRSEYNFWQGNELNVRKHIVQGEG